MTIFRLIPALLAGILAIASAALHAQIPESSTQLLVTITDDWEATTGHMYAFTRADGSWHREAMDTPVNIGRTGLAWGIGLHPTRKTGPVKGEGPVKREGDGKAPAGIFRLGDAFGYLPEVQTGLVYRPMAEGHFCVDVPGSPYYNQTIDALELGPAAVRGSSEGMRRDIHYGDQLYKKGIFVAHNPRNLDGAGSCIFMHLWKGPGEPTAGCTAFTEPAMDRLLAWLDRDAQPVYVALPGDEYLRLRDQWSLPEIAEEQ